MILFHFKDIYQQSFYLPILLESQTEDKVMIEPNCMYRKCNRKIDKSCLPELSQILT